MTRAEALRAWNAALDWFCEDGPESMEVGFARWWDDSEDARLEERCRKLIDAGRWIEAIKVYREETGANLRHAKNVIDGWRTDG